MNYGWRGKNEETGLSKGLRVLDEEAGEVEKIDVSTAAVETTPSFSCGVEECGKVYKAKHLIANHFRAKHPELDTEKDSWKEYVVSE